MVNPERLEGRRLRGSVVERCPSYGFLMGDDRLTRFFMPGDLLDGRERFGTLRNGDRVEFTSVAGRPGKGPRAIKIALLRNGEPASVDESRGV